MADYLSRQTACVWPSYGCGNQINPITQTVCPKALLLEDIAQNTPREECLQKAKEEAMTNAWMLLLSESHDKNELSQSYL